MGLYISPKEAAASLRKFYFPEGGHEWLAQLERGIGKAVGPMLMEEGDYNMWFYIA